MSDEDADLFHVPADVLTAMGRIAVAGGQLEYVAQSMALELGVDRRTMFAALTRQIQNAAAHGLPDYSRVPSSALIRWCEDSRGVMEQRNRLLHAAHFAVGADDGWEGVSEHLRSGTRRVGDRSRHVHQLADRLRELVQEGYVVWAGLLREVKPHVYLKKRRNEQDAFVMIAHGDDPNFPRPSESELDEWWDRYGPF